MLSPTQTLPSIDPRQLVNQCGLTRDGLATALNVAPSYVRKWFCEAQLPQPWHYRLAGEIKDKIDKGDYQVKDGFLFAIRTNIGK